MKGGKRKTAENITLMIIKEMFRLSRLRKHLRAVRPINAAAEDLYMSLIINVRRKQHDIVTEDTETDEEKTPNARESTWRLRNAVPDIGVTGTANPVPTAKG